jgi:hypothetical protein
LISDDAPKDLLAAIIQVGSIKLYRCVLCVLIGMPYSIEIVGLRLRHTVQYSVRQRQKIDKGYILLFGYAARGIRISLQILVVRLAFAKSTASQG